MQKKGRKLLLAFLMVMGLFTLLSRTIQYSLMPKVMVAKPVSITSEIDNQYLHGMVPQSAIIGRDTLYYIEEVPGFWGTRWVAKEARVSLGANHEDMVQIKKSELISRLIIIAWDRPLHSGAPVTEALR